MRTGWIGSEGEAATGTSTATKVRGGGGVRELHDFFFPSMLLEETCQQRVAAVLLFGI